MATPCSAPFLGTAVGFAFARGAGEILMIFAALGVGLQAMISVRLKRHYKPDVEAFRQHALELPEVVRLYHVAGPIDFLAHVWTKDSEHLRDLAMTAFTSREEVSHIETELIFEHVSCQELPAFLDEL